MGSTLAVDAGERAGGEPLPVLKQAGHGRQQEMCYGSISAVPTMTPFLVLNYILCLNGLYPSRN